MSVIMNNVTVRCESSESKSTHPSVRLKGAENVYDPVACQDITCAKKYVSHMHCPFCIRTEFFTDPVILRAHYRVKHVDKGIEFAGLKIVRCCDHCDIVGSIKGSKEIKGAHWHCFRCKNGFNRRDEALKHYRTHFRNAQTTFQIQITQDVNQSPVTSSSPNDMLTTSTAQDIVSVAEGIVAVSEDRCLQASVAANETVDTTTSDDLPTVMVLPSKNSLSDVIQADNGHEVNANMFNLNSEVASSSSSDAWSRQHSQKIDSLPTPTSGPAQLQIQQLQLQVQNQAAEIVALKRRVAELVGHLEVKLDEHVSQLLQKMKTEHEALLHRQLDELRIEYLRHIAPSPTAAPNHHPPLPTHHHPLPTHHHPLPQPLLILHGYNGQRIQVIPSAATKSFSSFSSGPELLSSILPSQDAEEAAEEDEDEKDSSELVEDGLVPENVQNFIVAADDMSEYVDAEDDEQGPEISNGSDTCDPDGDRDGDQDAVEDRDGNRLSKRKADDELDCGVSSKRERL